MTEKQKKLFELYTEIDKICKENDIEYYLAGGSIIGVVRHRGFIPWDDDMDLLMTKKNFNKFIEACKTQIPENRVLECQELNHGYHNTFARYTETNTCVIHANQLFYNDTAGYIVDILQLDPLPDPNESYKKYLENVMLYSDIINCTVGYSYRWGFNKWRYKFARLKCRIFGKDKVLNDLEKQMWCYDEDKCDYLAMRWGGIPFIFEKKMYEGKRYYDFFGIDAQIPNRASDYLVWHYGDEWVNIPPHNEQEGHVALYSMDFDYKTVKGEIDRIINRKQAFRKMLRRKNAIMSVMDVWNKQKDSRISTKLLGYECDFNNYFNKNKQEILDLYNKKDFVALGSIFSEYFSVQLNRSVIGREDFSGAYRFNNPILMNIDKVFFEIACQTLMYIDKTSSAMRLMDIYQKVYGNKSEVLDKLRENIMIYRTAVSCDDMGECDVTAQNIEYLIGVYPTSIPILHFAIGFMLKQKNPQIERISKLVKTGLEIAENDGVFIKYQADLEKDEYEKIRLYSISYTSTTNGMILLDIHDIFMNNIDLLKKYALHLKEQDIEQAKFWLNDTVKIIPECNELWTFYVSFYTDLIKNEKDAREFSHYMNLNLKYLIENEIEADSFVFALEEYLTTVTGNPKIAKLMLELKYAKEYSEYKEISEKASALFDKTTDTQQVAWLNKIYADSLQKIGQVKESFKYYFKAVDDCDSFWLLGMLSSTFKRTIKNAYWQIERFKTYKHLSQIAEHQDLDENAYILNLNNVRKKLIKDYLSEFNSIFKSASNLIEILEKLEIFTNTQANDIKSKIKDEKITQNLIATLYDIISMEYETYQDTVEAPNDIDESYSSDDISDEENMRLEVSKNNSNLSNAPVIELLNEMKQICDENDIRFCLFGETCAKAVLGAPIDKSFVQIMMTVENFAKLTKIMEGKTLVNRCYDTLHNNKNYMNFSARYSNPNTTSIDLHNTKRCIKTGAYVEILPLKSELENNKTRKLLRLKEQGFESTFYSFRRAIRVPVFAVTRAYTHIATLLCSKKKYASKLFEKLSTTYSGEILNTCSIKQFGKTLVKFNENPVSSTDLIEFYGENYRIPTHFNYFLKRVCGDDWRTKFGVASFSTYEVSCNSMAVDDFVTKYDAELKTVEKYANQKILTSGLAYRYNRYKKRIWSKAKIIQRRASLYSYYSTRRELIRKLYDDKDYFELEKVLKFNFKAIKQAYNHNIGFAIDKELYDISIDVLRYFGNKKLTDKLEKITPDFFMNSIGKN